MPRGQPDFGIYQSQYTITGMADPGEAAARLGSINIYDRRGWTVWMDDFEAPALRWEASQAATGILPHLDTTRFFSGTQCIHLDVPMGASPFSSIRRDFPLIRRGKIGIEFWVQGFTKTPGRLQLELEIYDGVTPYRTTLRYDTDAQVISIVDPTGVIPIVTDAFMAAKGHYFLPIKLVVDMDTDLYTRLVVGETEHDLSAYSQVLRPASANKYVLLTITVYGSAVDNVWAYIDNFILTQNEP